MAFRDAIAQEDSVPGAAVQQGRPARAGDRGRCAVARANGVPQLHGLAYAYRGGSSRRAT